MSLWVKFHYKKSFIIKALRKEKETQIRPSITWIRLKLYYLVIRTCLLTIKPYIDMNKWKPFISLRLSILQSQIDALSQFLLEFLCLFLSPLQILSQLLNLITRPLLNFVCPLFRFKSCSLLFTQLMLQPLCCLSQLRLHLDKQQRKQNHQQKQQEFIPFYDINDTMKSTDSWYTLNQ